MDLIVGVLTMVGGVALTIVIGYLRARVAGRRYDADEQGESVRLRCRLRGDRAPFPPRFARGTVRTRDDQLGWAPRSARGPSVPLAGLRLVRTTLRERRAGASGDRVVFLLRAPDGARVELMVGEDDAELAHAALLRAADATAPGQMLPPLPLGSGRGGDGLDRRRRPRGPVPWWAAGLLALAVVWAAGWAWLALGGAVVPAIVLANDDFGCLVRWADPTDRSPHEAYLDC